MRALVTGGATGIGAALVRAFAAQGAHVGFIDNDVKAASALQAEVTNDLGSDLQFHDVDVTDVAQLRAAIEAFCVEGLDVLVNNVANDTRHDFMTMDEASWRACLAVNLDAAFFACQTAAQPMRQAGAGAIINLSSINATLGPAGMPGYVTAKSALLGLTKSLARELGPHGVRANVIAPGWVATERQLQLWLTPEAEKEWSKLVALPQRILPEDVARLALFLAADDSRMITGQTFVIDAGRT